MPEIGRRYQRIGWRKLHRTRGHTKAAAGGEVSASTGASPHPGRIWSAAKGRGCGIPGPAVTGEQ
jgi:hypothetical protein